MPSRRSNLSVSTAVGEPEFNIAGASWVSDLCWKNIEKAYGHSLSDTVRNQIAASTKEYLDFEEFERNAEPVSSTQEKIERITKAAGELKIELGARANGDDTLLEARYRIAEKFQYSVHRGRAALSEFEELLLQLQIGCHQLQTGCDQVLKEIEETKERGFIKGRSWDQWVQALITILAKYKLPTHASKGTDKSLGYISPFVLLFDELQKCLPVECRRHAHSHAALAQAISRARTTGRERKPKSRE